MDPTIDLYVVISLSAMGLGIFFLLYLATNKSYYTLPNLVLGIIIFTLCFEIWNDVLIHSRYIYQFPWFFKLGSKFKLFLITTILLYTLLITSDGNRFKPLLLLIYLPFAIDLPIWMHGFVWFSVEDKLRMIDMFYADLRPGPANIWWMPRQIVVAFLVPGGLLSVAIYRLYHYSRRQAEKTKVSLRVWMVLLVGVMLYILLGNTLIWWIYRLTGESFIDWTVELMLMCMILLAIAFFIMKQLEISKDPLGTAGVEKYRNSTLSNLQLENILIQIKQVMEEEQLYLDPEFSMMKLSEIMDVNGAYLSQSVNKGLDLRFTDFVNRYRVTASKEYLSDVEHDKFTIEAIANKSGFRSKSAFYRAFQKETGLSPADFKKQRQ